MRLFFRYLAISIALQFSGIWVCPASFAESSEAEIRAEYQTFLKSIGFENYTRSMQRSLREDLGAGGASDTVLENTIEKYRVVNDARDLAVQLITQLELRSGDKELRADMAEFAARMLALQPINPPSEIPLRVLNEPPSKRVKAIEEYLTEVTKKNMEAHASAVAADIVETLYGKDVIEKTIKRLKGPKVNDPAFDAKLKEIREAQKLATRLVYFTYLNGEMGQTRYFGRAMAASLLKYAKDHNDPGLKKRLQNRVAKEGLILENFVATDEFTGVMVRDNHGTMREVDIQNGDFVMERSRGDGAANITSGARPHPSNYIRAWRMGMLGHLYDNLVQMGEENPATQTSFLDRQRANLSQWGHFNKGVSHVGMANVLRDPKTNIGMVWFLDTYPDVDEGSIRVIGFEQFATPGPYMRFSRSRYDPEKFWRHAQDYIKTHGYQDVAWLGEKEEVYGKNRGKEGEEDPIETAISKGTFERLHNVPREKAEEWYAEVMKRITDHIRGPMLKRDGIGFAYDFTNYKGRAFCSQLLCIAAKQSVGIDLQKRFDRFHAIVPILAKLGFEDATELKLDQRIIAPAGYMWQPMTSEYVTVTYPEMTFEQQMKSLFQPHYVGMNPRTEERLRTLNEFNQLVRQGLEEGPAYEIVENIEAALRGQQRQADAARRHRGRRNRASQTTQTGYSAVCARYLDELSVLD